MTSNEGKAPHEIVVTLDGELRTLADVQHELRTLRDALSAKDGRVAALAKVNDALWLDVVSSESSAKHWRDVAMRRGALLSKVNDGQPTKPGTVAIDRWGAEWTLDERLLWWVARYPYSSTWQELLIDCGPLLVEGRTFHPPVEPDEPAR